MFGSRAQATPGDYTVTHGIKGDKMSWSSIATSADGTKLAAAVQGGYIYTSIDSGVTWTPSTAGGSQQWQSIASSADGTKLAAVVYSGFIYTSSDRWSHLDSAN